MNFFRRLFAKQKKTNVAELFTRLQKSMQVNIEAMHILRDTVKDIYSATSLEYLKKNDDE